MNSHKKYTEDELVVLLQLKNKEAFAYLYDNYAASLNGVIVSVTEDKQLAEDVLQEVFIKIWKQFPKYDKAKGRLFTWMFNLARNHSIDTIRSRQQRNKAKTTSITNVTTDLKDASYKIEKFDSIGINKKLSLLKPELYLLINMAYFSGYTQSEMAEITGIPLGTVKARIRNALFQLQSQLQ